MLKRTKKPRRRTRAATSLTVETVQRGVVEIPHGRAAAALYVVHVLFEQRSGPDVRGQRQRRLSRVRGQPRVGAVTQQQPYQMDVAVFDGFVQGPGKNTVGSYLHQHTRVSVVVCFACRYTRGTKNDFVTVSIVFVFLSRRNFSH